MSSRNQDVIVDRRGLRRMPRSFSWVDPHVAVCGHLRELDLCAQGLYLFLATVGNRNGVSWYGDRALKKLSGLSQAQLEEGRQQLVKRRLIAFEAPFYQVLEVPRESEMYDLPKVKGSAADPAAGSAAGPAADRMSAEELLGRLADLLSARDSTSA